MLLLVAADLSVSHGRTCHTAPHTSPRVVESNGARSYLEYGVVTIKSGRDTHTPHGSIITMRNSACPLFIPTTLALT